MNPSWILMWTTGVQGFDTLPYPVSVSMFDPRSKMIILSSNLESMDSNRSCRVSNRLGPASWMKNPAPWTSSGSVHPMRSNECETCLVRGAAFSLDPDQLSGSNATSGGRTAEARRVSASGVRIPQLTVDLHSGSALRCGCGKMVMS